MEKIKIDIDYKLEGTTLYCLCNEITGIAKQEALMYLASALKESKNLEITGVGEMTKVDGESEPSEAVTVSASETKQENTSAEQETTPEETEEIQPTTKKIESETEPLFKRGNKVNYQGGTAPKSDTEQVKCSPIKGTFVWAVFYHIGWIYIIEHPQGFTKQHFMDDAKAHGKEDFVTILNQKLQDNKNYILVPESDLELAE